MSVVRQNCVGQLSKHGRQLAIPAIEVAIAMLAEFFGQDFSELQIKETAKLIYDNWYWLDVAEFKVAIDRIKTQHYEKLYGKFSPAYIMEVFQRLSQESIVARETESFGDYDQIKKLDEGERDQEREFKEVQEDKIHQSAIQHFKEHLELNKPNSNATTNPKP